jgi:hypothetical protein
MYLVYNNQIHYLFNESKKVNCLLQKGPEGVVNDTFMDEPQ